MRLRILKDHDYRQAPARIQAFRAGTEVNVPKAVAAALVAAGAAQPIDPAALAVPRADKE